jgi:hypothetical protein
MDWRETRAYLNAHRDELDRIASTLYPDARRVEGTPLLAAPEWVPKAPIPLESVRLHWNPQPPAPAVADPEDGLPEGYETYAQAMAALAPPKVFEDRPSYRLLTADLVTRHPGLTLGPSHYFAGLNVGEAVAHELAAKPDAARLPLRERVGDPCDLSRRTALPAITTVTVTRSGSYVLHWRDPAKVAHAGGLHQVMPVGVFQPLDDDGRAELNLWRCMVREFSEELLGTDEHYGPGFAQEQWPFHQALTQARHEGRLDVHCLGMGVDPLTLALDVLTVAVFDDATFDGFFGAMVDVNAEGRVSLAAFDGTVPEPMQPAGAAALRLAWRHRTALRING